MKAIDVSQMDSEALFARIQSEIAQRAAAMPTEEDAMVAMLQAFERLKELGWKEAMYCPKDGTLFWALEPGCSAAGVCQYIGNWPAGRYWMHSGGDLWPSRPALFKLMDQKSISGIGCKSPKSEADEMRGEIERLRKALANAERRSEYWKAEHLAGNAEIDRLRESPKAEPR